MNEFFDNTFLFWEKNSITHQCKVMEKMWEEEFTTYNVWMLCLICCHGAAGILDMKFHIAELAKVL